MDGHEKAMFVVGLIALLIQFLYAILYGGKV